MNASGTISGYSQYQVETYGTLDVWLLDTVSGDQRH